MPERILFVAGDVGGANAQVRVAKKFLEEADKYEIKVLVDKGPRAKAGEAWKKANISYETVSIVDVEAIEKWIHWSDVIVSGSCATAWHLESAVIKIAKDQKKPSAILADVVFSHCYPYFQELDPTNWFALDHAHKDSILAKRPWLDSKRVVVTGQPTYDNLKDILTKKDEIRKTYRTALGLNEENYVVLYSSPGDKAASFETTLEMILMGLKVLQRIHGERLTFLPRLHPKLGTNTKCDGYVNGAYERIEEFCKTEKIKLVRQDQAPMDELDIVCDLLTSAISTDATKTVMMGGIAVFLLPDTVQYRLEVDLSREHPYLPELERNAAFGIFSYREVEKGFLRSQDSHEQKLVKKNAKKYFSLPDISGTENVFNTICNIARHRFREETTVRP